MRTVPMLAAFLLAASFALPATAAKGPPKLRVIGPMQLELGDALSDESWKALKVVDRCASADKTWQRAMLPEQNNGIDMIYETLLSPVTCWQNATKKAEKAGPELAAITSYATAQRDYVETLRAYIFALQAKMTGDQLNGCKRFQLSIAEAAEAATSSTGLIDRFTSAESKTLAAQVDENVRGMAVTITAEYAAMKCD